MGFPCLQPLWLQEKSNSNCCKQPPAWHMYCWTELCFTRVTAKAFQTQVLVVSAPPSWVV